MTTREASGRSLDGMTDTMPRAEFRAMAEGTQEDWNRIMHAMAGMYAALSSSPPSAM